MLTAKNKSKLLNDAVDLLEQVDMLQQKALGACDVCEDNHCRIQNLIDDLIAEIAMLDSEAA